MKLLLYFIWRPRKIRLWLFINRTFSLENVSTGSRFDWIRLRIKTEKLPHSKDKSGYALREKIYVWHSTKKSFHLEFMRTYSECFDVLCERSKSCLLRYKPDILLECVLNLNLKGLKRVFSELRCQKLNFCFITYECIGIIYLFFESLFLEGFF